MKENNIFINCPYDKSFEPVLYAIMFTCVALGCNPILSKIDTYNPIRIKNIVMCIENSSISIHDLSIMGKNANSRYNMPLEIGMAVMYHLLNCQKENIDTHNIIILEPQAYLTQKCCSDLNAFDPIYYNKENDLENLIKNLADKISSIIKFQNLLEPHLVFNKYLDFQTYMYDNNLWNKITLYSIRNYMKNFLKKSNSSKNEDTEIKPITQEELNKILV